MDTKLSFDNTYIGDISDFLEKKNDTEYYQEVINGFLIMKLNLASGKQMMIVVDDFDTRYLIAEKLKSYFNLLSIGFHTAYIGDKKFLISEYEYNILFSEKYKDDNYVHMDPNQVYVKELRKCFAFQWIMHLHDISEERILIRKMKYFSSSLPKESFYPTSCNERYVCTNKQIPLNKKFIDKWYKGHYNFYHTIYKLFEGRSRDKIASDIRDIILKIDKNYISWTFDIMNQVDIVFANM